MQVVADSRVIKNLARDIKENKRPPEDSISFLNTTNDFVDLYDYETRSYYISYPGTIITIERPKKLIFFGLNQSNDVGPFDEAKYDYKIVLSRQQLKKKYILIRGPTEYKHKQMTYMNALSEKWFAKQIRATDTIILAMPVSKIVFIDAPKNKNYAPAILIFIVVAILITIFAVVIKWRRSQSQQSKAKIT
jgi:hypothetical protein